MLNFKYSLRPNACQEHHLRASMKLMRWGWNLAVRREKWARRMIRRGRAADLKKELAELARGRRPVGRRQSKINALVAGGKTREDALSSICSTDIRRIWRKRGSSLSVAYAVETTKVAKQGMLGGRLGSALAKLLEDKGIFVTAWEACWKGIRRAPRKNKDFHRGWLNVQIQNSRNLITAPARNSHSDQYVDLGRLMPGVSGASAKVRFLAHRPLPAGAEIVEMKVTRHRRDWFVIFTVKNEMPKDYPQTGRSCGIDPGQKTPITVVGEEMEPGLEGKEYGPGRPLTKRLKKLRRLQRKLDRQRRANNPEASCQDGSGIQGKSAKTVSRGMSETEDRIAKEHKRCSDIRRDCWNKAAHEILKQYDTVYVGSWTDGTPAQKGKARDARKKAFQASGEKRPKGQAAQQTTRNRVNRDNALGGFRTVLEEKAKRSLTPKTVVFISERNTTRSCCRCGSLSGPTGLTGLSKRIWTCRECGFEQKRDCGAAWNILQAGRQQAGGQPVKEGRNPLVAGGSQDLFDSVPGIEQTFASGQAASSSQEALARRQVTVLKEDGDINNRGPSLSMRSGPQPLAKGTANSRKI